MDALATGQQENESYRQEPKFKIMEEYDNHIEISIENEKLVEELLEKFIEQASEQD